MAFASAVTQVGVAAAELADLHGLQVSIDSATFSTNVLSSDPAVLSEVTSLTGIVYTLTAAAGITYHRQPDGHTIMFRMALPSAAAFTFSSFSLNLSDGTVFVVGSWDSVQTKSAGQVRYIEQNVVLNTTLPTIDLTVLNTIDAALPEVATEADLPLPLDAPYPVYLVDSWTAFGSKPALASRVSGAWNFHPAVRNLVTAGTYNTITVNAYGWVTNGSNTSYSVQLIGDVLGTGTVGSPITTTLATQGGLPGGGATYNNVTVNNKGLVVSGTNINYVLRAGDTMTGNLTIAAPNRLFVDSIRFVSDPGQDTGIGYGGSDNIMNFISGNVAVAYVSPLGINIPSSKYLIADHWRFISDSSEDTGISWGGEGYIDFISENTVVGSISPTGRLAMTGPLSGANATLSNEAVMLGQFSVAFTSTTSYAAIPGSPYPMIIQQGRVTINGSADTIQNFPVAFPHACMAVIPADDPALVGYVPGSFGYSNSIFLIKNDRFSCKLVNLSSDLGISFMDYVAIGY